MQATQKFCQLGLAVIETEAKAVLDLASRIDGNFAKACQHLLDCDFCEYRQPRLFRSSGRS
jgi:hypothetical protein